MSRLNLSAIFREINDIAGVCPSCGCLFRVTDARPHTKLKGTQTLLDKLEADAAKLERSLDSLEEREVGLRQLAHQEGLRSARRRLRAIDRVFTRSRLDPHDVKVICDPVEYVVFDGLNRGKLRRVLLLGHQAQTQREEELQSSVRSAVEQRAYRFRTLRVGKDATLSLQ